MSSVNGATARRAVRQVIDSCGAPTPNARRQTLDIAQGEVSQQKHQEAEVLTTSGTTVGFTADGNGVQVQSIDPGDWIALGGPSLDPVNFLNMSSISFRVQAAGTAGNPRAAAELRFDAPDGPLAATIGINSTGNVYATQTTAVSYPSGTHKLYLVFRSIPGGPTTNLFNLNWFEFGGQGVGTP
jgi:cytochrome c